MPFNGIGYDGTDGGESKLALQGMMWNKLRPVSEIACHY